MPSTFDNDLSPIDGERPDGVLPTGGGHLPGQNNPPRKEPTDADEQGIGPDEGTPPGDDVDLDDEDDDSEEDEQSAG